GKELRQYVAEKVKKYVGENPSVFDGAIGSGQLEQYINPSKLVGVEIQELACKTFEQNSDLFPNREIFNMSFFQFNENIKTDCVVMNPPFSLKFKELPEEDRLNIQKDFPWKKSGVVDDIFILKSLKYTDKFAFHICFPGIAYRKTEQMMRDLIGNRLVEMNLVYGAFEDTAISVLMLIIAKEGNYDGVHKEIYDCKSKKVLHAEISDKEDDRWSSPSIPLVKEIVDIDAINKNLDDMVISRLENHLKLTLGIIREFNADIDYLGFIDKVESLCQEYRLAYNFGVNTFGKY
ncbi:N-6 DNA methylase, partial [Gemella morbillorum]